MQMTIVSLAFDFCDKGVVQCHNAFDYILETGKVPILGKLWTIKILECDLNFGLKWDFAWRLGAFAEKHDLYKRSQHALLGRWYHYSVLNKTPTFDLLQQNHMEGAFGDYIRHHCIIWPNHPHTNDNTGATNGRRSSAQSVMLQYFAGGRVHIIKGTRVVGFKVQIHSGSNAARVWPRRVSITNNVHMQ